MLRARGGMEGAGGGKAIKDAPRPGRPPGGGLGGSGRWGARRRAHTHTHTHARAHALTHTHTHTHTHARARARTCLRSMTPCQNIKCMLWLLSQMCVRFFKSIDSRWINGNRGLSFFFLVQKGVITLCREAPPSGVARVIVL